MSEAETGFSLIHHIDGTTATLHLAGELDTHTSQGVDDLVHTLVGQGVDALIFDLGGVSFIDSSGLRSLIRARRALGDADGCVRLKDPRPGTCRLLEITGLVEQFPTI